MKKFLALLLALIMVISMVACGNEEPAANEPAATEPAATEPAATEPVAEPVTIRVASYRSEDEAIYQEMVKMFNVHYPHITVELDLNADQTSYYQNLQADVMDGKAPDVFDMHTNTDFVTYAQEGIILAQDDMAYLANYQDGARAITSVDGSNYGFLNAYNMIAVIYNKAIFEKEGLAEPKTFDEFVTLCKTLRDKGYGGVAYPGGTVADAWLTKALLNITMSAPGYKDIMEGMDSGKYTDINTVAGMTIGAETTNAYRDNNLLYDASEATALDQVMTLFATEQAPMMINGTWVFGTKANDFPNIDAGVFAIPTMANNGKHYAEGAQVTCINASGENIDAAKAWVDFKASLEGASYYCSNAKMISTIEGVGLDYEGGDVLAAAAANGVEVLPNIVYANKDYWNKTWKAMLNSLLYGDAKAADAIAEYNKALVDLNLAG